MPRSLVNALVVAAVCLAAAPRPLAAKEIRVATWNVEWLNDHDAGDDRSEIGPAHAAPSRRHFKERIEAIAAAVAELDAAVVALQEVENARVVEALAAELGARHGLSYDVAFRQGSDRHTGQDVAFLVRRDAGLRNARRFDYAPLRGRGGYKDLSKHLAVDVILGGEPVRLVTVHLVTDPRRRLEQARTLRAWIEPAVRDENLIVLGDLNAYLRFAETTPASDVGVLRGFATASTDDDLFDAHALLGRRATHAGGRELDRVLVSPRLRDGHGLELRAVETRRDLAVRGAEDRKRGVDYALPAAERDLSDHFPLVVTLATDAAPTAADEAAPAHETDEAAPSTLDALLDWLADALSRLAGG